MFDSKEFYARSEVAPAGEAYPALAPSRVGSLKERVDDVEGELAELSMEEEEAARASRQEYLNRLIQTGQIRVTQPEDLD